MYLCRWSRVEESRWTYAADPFTSQRRKTYLITVKSHRISCAVHDYAEGFRISRTVSIMEIAAALAGLMSPRFGLRISSAYTGVLRYLAVPDAGSFHVPCGGAVNGGGGGSLQQSSLDCVFIRHPLKKYISHSPPTSRPLYSLGSCIRFLYSLRSVVKDFFVPRDTLFLLPYGQETL